MKRKDLQVLRTKDIKDIRKTIGEVRLDYKKTIVNLRGGKEKNLKKAGSLRRDLAQILTILREKEIQEFEMNRKPGGTGSTENFTENTE